MSGSLYRNNSSNDEFQPKKEFNCAKCNQDIHEPIEVMEKHGHLVKKERPYTYYKGRMVCIPCFFELEKIDPIINDGKIVQPNSELF